MLAEATELVGSQLQRVAQPDEHTVCLRLMRTWLQIGVQPGQGRLHQMSTRPRDLPAQAKAFCMLLRKVLLNSRLAALERLNNDRVVRLVFTGGVLLAELTPRRANLLLLEAGDKVLGSLLPLRPGLGVGEQYAAPSRPPHLDRAATPREPRWTSSAQVEDFFAGLGERLRLEGLARRVRRTLKKSRRTLTKVEADQARCQQGDRYRKWADLLMAQQSQVKGKGLTEVALPDLFEGGEPVTIPLDPRLNAVKNAQRLYRQHRRLTTGLTHIGPRLEAANSRVMELQELLQTLEHPDTESSDTEPSNTGFSDRVAEQVDALCPERPQQPRASKAGKVTRLPYRQFRSSQGLEILVGRGARDNHHLTFKVARGRDLWLHARDLPGCHGVVRLEGNQPPGHATLLDAATLVAHFSRVKAGQTVEITHTLRKNVRPVSGSPGKVYVSEAHTLRLVVDPERLAGLLKR